MPTAPGTPLITLVPIAPFVPPGPPSLAAGLIPDDYAEINSTRPGPMGTTDDPTTDHCPVTRTFPDTTTYCLQSWGNGSGSCGWGAACCQGGEVVIEG